jgi:predicted transcriptional regulator
MKRITIRAPEDLLERLRSIARREHVSLAEVIRQALEWRAEQSAGKPGFIAAGRSTEPHDAAREAGDLDYTPRSWR